MGVAGHLQTECTRRSSSLRIPAPSRRRELCRPQEQVHEAQEKKVTPHPPQRPQSKTWTVPRASRARTLAGLAREVRHKRDNVPPHHERKENIHSPEDLYKNACNGFVGDNQNMKQTNIQQEEQMGQRGCDGTLLSDTTLAQGRLGDTPWSGPTRWTASPAARTPTESPPCLDAWRQQSKKANVGTGGKDGTGGSIRKASILPRDTSRERREKRQR